MAGEQSTPFRVGDKYMHPLRDGTFFMREGFMNRPGFQDRYVDGSGEAALPIGCFLIPGDTTVLIDAGLGPRRVGEILVGGALLSELAALGVAPEDIDVVAISHLHLDHDGWVADAEAQPVFPNATIWFGQGDWDHFVMTDEIAPRIKSVMRDLAATGRLELIDDTTEIVQGVVALPTPGHTPGHTVFAIRDQGEQLMILGDALYCPEQLTDMDLTAMHDVDPAAARRSRELIAREMERHDTRGLGCHFPGLRASRIVGGEYLVD